MKQRDLVEAHAPVPDGSGHNPCGAFGHRVRINPSLIAIGAASLRRPN